MDGSILLRELLTELGLEPSQQSFTRLALDTSRLAGKSKPWGWKYLDNVHRGRQDASKILTNALLAMLSATDGVPALLVTAKSANVLLPPHLAEELAGRYIMANVPVTCRQCGLIFSPNVPQRKDCPACSPPRLPLPTHAQRTRNDPPGRYATR